MIPLRDFNPTWSTPVVTWTLVTLNVAVFALTFADLESAARDWGAVAAHYTTADPRPVFDGRSRIPAIPADGAWWLRTVTHMFMHAGFLHIAGNMLFLWVFGDNIEDRMGRLRFLALYFGAGFAALAAQVVSDPSYGGPMVGASGAVAGVLGAYLRLFPHARVLGLVPLGFLFFTVVWPAGVFLGIWFAMQILNAAIAGAAEGGVAWWAHIGGFAVGFLGASPRRARRVENAHRSDYAGLQRW